MESNNIIAAPQVKDVGHFYELWKRDHAGGLSSFYEFMTTPTVERDKFISSSYHTVQFNGAVASQILKIK